MTSGARVTVLFFAQLRAAARTDELQVRVDPGTTVRMLAGRLEEDRPGLALSGSMVAVDEAYAEPDRILRGGETVAFLPPVSGG